MFLQPKKCVFIKMECHLFNMALIPRYQRVVSPVGSVTAPQITRQTHRALAP